MSTTTSVPLRGRALLHRVWKLTLRRVLVPVCIWGPFAYFFPKTALVYAICGIYDVSRNRPLTLSTVRRYFLGNGVILWILSPINVLTDLLSLPYPNKAIYRLEDLPLDYQEEVRELIKIAKDSDLVHRAEERSREHKRAMFYWRASGFDLQAAVDVPAFHKPWKYIQTIGLSVFNKKVTTSQHFGRLRAILRVLYNINDISDRSAYIVVGDKTHYWCDDKLFIFDDTLLHLSANESDRLRYCMFIDILRPSHFPRVLAAIVAIEGFIGRKLKLIAYSGWTLVER